MLVGIARDGGATHIPDLCVVERNDSMHRRAIIPHQEVVLAPDVAVDRAGADGPLGELADEQPRLVHWPTGNGANMRRQIQRFSSGDRVSPHQRLLDRIEGGPFGLAHLSQTQRLTGVNPGMFTEQVFDESFRLDVQLVVGRPHIGEFGIAALCHGDATGQDRVFRRYCPKRAV
jgi:hypothetical protein